MTREEMEDQEIRHLAPYAIRSRDSRGRKHSEAEHPFRTAFQRDRDRIVHSRAFRRLEYKTQVFVYHEGDHFRTRLTHTLETASMARTIARALRLNEDLAEAIALAHDLGHPPFGHSGEAVLNRLMEGHGGFEHNRQGLRLVEILEDRYPGFKGLNLTRETLEGIGKHTREFDRPGPEEVHPDLKPGPSPPLEAQVADLCDEIAYNNHDIDDGLSSNMLEPKHLMTIDLWRAHYEAAVSECPSAEFRVHKHQTIRRVINEQVGDVINTTEERLGALRVQNPDEVRAHPDRIVRFSEAVAEKNAALKAYLFRHMYRHHRVIRMENKADRILTDVFQAYLKRPEQLPPRVFEKIQTGSEGAERVICDYVAGMTDRFAQDEHQKLFDPHARV